MLTDSQPRKPGPKPRALMDMKVSITPELNTMLDRIVTSTGISKAALVRDALARYGETLGYLPEGSADLIAPTLTSGPGLASANRKEVHA
jgi:hypothetical protein